MARPTTVLRALLALVAALTTVALLASTASAQPPLPVPGTAPTEITDHRVTSFDGTELAVTLFAADEDGPASVIMVGHLGANARTTSPGDVVVDRYVAQGYHVLTWDERGWGGSDGTYEFGNIEFDGRDVAAIVSWLAERDHVALDGPGDPKLGIFAPGYSAFSTTAGAALGPRIDAIVTESAPYDLIQTFRPNRVHLSGWEIASCGMNATQQANGVRTGYGPHTPSGPMLQWCADALHQNWSPDTQAFMAQRSLRRYIDGGRLADGTPVPGIGAATFILRGARNTLGPLSQGERQFTRLSDPGRPGGAVPTKLMVYCGGVTLPNPADELQPCGPANEPSHGATLSGFPEHTYAAMDAWFERHVMGKRGTDTGPSVEIQTPDTVWQGYDELPRIRRVRAQTDATLVHTGTATSDTVMTSEVVTCALGDSGGDGARVETPIVRVEAYPPSNDRLCEETWVPVEGLRAGDLLFGTGRVTMTVLDSDQPEVHAFVKLIDVDTRTGEAEVIDDQVSPLRVAWPSSPGPDVARGDLHGVAWRVEEGHQIYLAVAPSSHMYGNARVPGVAEVHIDARISVIALDEQHQ